MKICMQELAGSVVTVEFIAQVAPAPTVGVQGQAGNADIAIINLQILIRRYGAEFFAILHLTVKAAQDRLRSYQKISGPTRHRWKKQQSEDKYH